MIIMPSLFSFLFRNVNSSHTLAATILEEHATSDIDIIFFQELTQKEIWHATHIDHVDGEPVFGLPIHPAWTSLPPPGRNSQVAIFVHQRIFQRYHFSMDNKIFGHPNIFVMFCFNPATNISLSYINIYANPNRACPAPLQRTIPMLIQNLYKLDNIHLIQGDFNLHCHYWDEDSTENPPLAWELIRTLHDKQLLLVNDDSTPTFHWPNHRPQVLDLIWINDQAYNWHGIHLIYDITGPFRDHRSLLLRFGNAESALLENNHLLRRYIPTGSEEEEHLVFHVFEDLPNRMLPDPTPRAAQMINSFTTAWDKYSKPGLAQFNQWWNNDCQVAKQAFNNAPSFDNHQEFLRQCKRAKKAYFAKKIEEMVKSQKPWEGTSWIKQRALPKVPQISEDGRVITDLEQMFEKFHDQFAQSSATDTDMDFIESLPQCPTCSWPPFSQLELQDALTTCSNASAPGPSHMSWEYLKLFLKEDRKSVV